MHSMIFTKFIAMVNVVSILGTSFAIDSSKFSFSKESKKDVIVSSFNDKYDLTKSIEKKKSDEEKEIEQLTKQLVYLVLGKANTKNETSQQYYIRYKEYGKLRYKHDVPEERDYELDDEETLKKRSENTVYEMVMNSMFDYLEEVEVEYKSIGSIRVEEGDDIMMSSVNIPNVIMKTKSDINPMEYIRKQTNLVLYFFFKEKDGEYKPFYTLLETTETLDEYFSEVENSEDTASMQAVPVYDSELKDIYDYSKLEAISEATLNNIKTVASPNVVSMNSYYNNELVASANGIFIVDGLVVTTWNYLQKSLKEAQFIALKDGNGNSYKIDGIVTANPDTDIAIIKLKEKVSCEAKLGISSNLKEEDPVFIISSKTGVGLTLQKGIVLSNKDYIRNAIPLTDSDEGSPLINSNGEVVGMNTAKLINSSTSMAINSTILKEVQDKFSKIEFKDIESISFDDMKEKFYYEKYNKEKVKNSIPSDEWKTLSKIGKIEKKISLKLVKASYRDDIASMRYYNSISKYITSMEMSGPFRKELVKQGYKEIISSSKKCIYQNKEYKIIIMSEFNYLIVVMVKL